VEVKEAQMEWADLGHRSGGSELNKSSLDDFNLKEMVLNLQFCDGVDKRYVQNCCGS